MSRTERILFKIFEVVLFIILSPFILYILFRDSIDWWNWKSPENCTKEEE